MLAAEHAEENQPLEGEHAADQADGGEGVGREQERVVERAG